MQITKHDYALAFEVARRNCKTDFHYYLRYINPEYSSQWFHKIIARKCQDVAEGRIKKLMVLMPPQHGKSEITSRKLPTWILGSYPKTKIVLASYSASLAQFFGREIRRTIESYEYTEIFGSLTGDGFYNNQAFLETNKGGFVKVVGVGGSLTGTPADVAIIDDPVKDAGDAYSKNSRDKTWEWYMNVLQTRLHNDSRQILIMTRWHMDDLGGRLLDLDKGWDVISIPAIKDTGYIHGDPREEGSALWEQRHSLEKLLSVKELSYRTFSALYQQQPSVEGGNIIKSDWFGKISYPEFARMKENTPIVFFLDTAYTDKQVNDPTGIIATCKLGNNLYVTHAQKVLLKFPDLIRYIPKYVAQHGYTNNSSIRIEPKANGISVIDQLRESTGLNVTRTPSPTESKETRLNVISPTVESGRVILVEGPWNDEFITEVCSFPAQPHDEHVDLLCYGVEYHLNRGMKNSDLTNIFS